MDGGALAGVAYPKDDFARAPKVALSQANFGLYPMNNGLSRLAPRFAGEAAPVESKTQSAAKKPVNVLTWLKNHPLADPKFAFFIFALIPVQTLLAHNWLTLPMYVSRAFQGSAVGDNFEFAVNLNPLLIFFIVPIVAALTQKKKIYNMMIIGTIVMAAPTFILATGPTVWALAAYLMIMTIG